VIFDQRERTRLEQPDCVDCTLRHYQPNTSIRSEPGAYTNSWILQPTKLLADDWNFAVTSGTQTTIAKVKYCPSRQIWPLVVVQTLADIKRRKIWNQKQLRKNSKRGLCHQKCHQRNSRNILTKIQKQVLVQWVWQLLEILALFKLNILFILTRFRPFSGDFR
jgi:hypothetical protein